MPGGVAVISQIYVLAISLALVISIWIVFWPKRRKVTNDKESAKTKLVITGMHCTGCSANIEGALSNLPGIQKVSVNFSTGLADVNYDPLKLTLGKIVKTITNTGFQARTLGNQSLALKSAREGKLSDVKKLQNRLLVGLPFSVFVLFFSMATMFWHFPPWFIWVLIAMSLPVIIYTGGHFFEGAFKSAMARQTDMNTLVALGVGSSFLYSVASVVFPSLGQHALYLDGAVVIIMLVLLGNYLRSRAELLAMKEIFDVASLLPETVHKVVDDQITDVLISELIEGDTILIRATERAPADSIVIKGQTEFNNAHITGESMPVSVNVGDFIYAGAINSFGAVEARCEKVGDTTVLSRVIELVITAIQTKPKVQGFVDKIASIFVPTSITIALVAFNVWFLMGLTEVAINTAISVLVISCPCALGLATPTSISIALGISAKSGMLIKDARSLEALQDVKFFVFDKTGTLTQGKPKVTSVHAESISENELLRLAVSAEVGSEHSLAHAIRDYANEKQVSSVTPQEFTAMPGLGVWAKIDGKDIYVGGPRLVENLKANLSLTLAGAFSPEEAVFYVVDGHKVVGGFGLSDPIKEDAVKAVSALKELGVEVVLVSGDRKEVCEAVAVKLGIQRVYSQTLPEEKVQVVEALQKDGQVAMMGDGVNDAAALAMADASFAPKSGTGMALDTADVTIMRDSLMLIPQTVKLAKATRRNILWNLFWAFIYNTISIPIAAGILYPIGILLDPMIASAAMAASSVTVVLSALRLKSFKIE
jgi:Cu+-exporting ATPase